MASYGLLGTNYIIFIFARNKIDLNEIYLLFLLIFNFVIMESFDETQLTG